MKLETGVISILNDEAVKKSGCALHQDRSCVADCYTCPLVTDLRIDHRISEPKATDLSPVIPRRIPKEVPHPPA